MVFSPQTRAALVSRRFPAALDYAAPIAPEALMHWYAALALALLRPCLLVTIKSITRVNSTVDWLDALGDRGEPTRQPSHRS